MSDPTDSRVPLDADGWPTAPTGQHQTGTDHPWFDWSILPERPPLRWPGEASLALGVIIVLEHVEWEPPPDAYGLRSSAGGLARLPQPDYLRLTAREYGHRVGVFRLLDALDRNGVPASVAVDALTVEHYPWLVEHLVGRGCELLAHGVSASRVVSSKMSEDEEAETIATSLDAIERATGTRPAGWLAPEGVESQRTPALLAASGIGYVCDWPNDEQPYPMTVPAGRLVSLPTAIELDDEFALWHRRARLDRWEATIGDAALRLRDDGVDSGRVMVLALRPWLTGQSFRSPAVDRALGVVTGLDGVWAATCGDIVDAYLAATAG